MRLRRESGMLAVLPVALAVLLVELLVVLLVVELLLVLLVAVVMVAPGLKVTGTLMPPLATVNARSRLLVRSASITTTSTTTSALGLSRSWIIFWARATRSASPR